MKEKSNNSTARNVLMTFVWILGWQLTAGIIISMLFKADPNMEKSLVVKTILVCSVGWPVVIGIMLGYILVLGYSL